MRIQEHENGTATIELEEYADLLTCRSLAEWNFVTEDPPTVETRTEHLALVGLAEERGRERWLPLPDFLFDYQRWTIERALDRERFAIFADCGLGKTAMQLEWARQIQHSTSGRVLILAPLQVVHQTVEEAEHWYAGELKVQALDTTAAFEAWCTAGSGIAITNYEKLEKAGPFLVDGVVLDESSVLKQSMGARRTAIINQFRGVRWKLCCTATPAPNDRVEYAEHAYFLDVVRSVREFISRFFVNVDGDWNLKHHGEHAFYAHLASWSVFMRDPAAYRFADNLRELSPITVKFPHITLTVEQAEAAREYEKGDQPSLFGATPGGIVSRTKLMQVAHGFELDGKGGIASRFPSYKPEEIARIVNDEHGDEQVIVWVTFDEEARQLEALIPDCAVISGKTARSKRDVLIDAFRQGQGPRVLCAKPSMLGFGLNLQSCRIQVFSTITDSFERYYQAVRRSHRYGQTRPVIVYVPLTPLDEAIAQNVLSKEQVWREDGRRQEQAYIDVLRPADTTERRVLVTAPQAELDRVESDRWTLIHGDSIEHMEMMEESSVDFSIFSPPFVDLFAYSSMAGDLGNTRSDSEYRAAWRWFAERLVRVMKPGRNVAIHCMDIIRFAGTHGVRHTYDYPSDLRQGMQDAGFLYRSRISIDKDPQIQACRRKDANLLFVTLQRNALDSHPQPGEYVLLFTTPGEPETPVIASDVSDREWIEWAHHVWYGIRETDVLNASLAKEHQDEKHCCPLQRELIERSVRLWSNPGEVVFSPFAGIGSEGWMSLEWGRRFYGVELKRSYFDQACRFLREKESNVAGRLDMGA